MASLLAGEQMRAELTAEITAPADLPRRLVGELDSWPGLFPPVDSVEPAGTNGHRVRLRWRGLHVASVCRREPVAPDDGVVIHAIRGFAGGFHFAWTFDEVAESQTFVRLSITCNSRCARVDRLRYRLFVEDLARQTLAMVVLLAEADAAAHALA